MLLEKISPKYLIEKTFGEGEEKKTVGDIWEALLKFSHLPLLENEGVLENAIVEGVRNKTLGLVDGEKTYFAEDILESQVSEEAEVVRSKLAEELKEEVEVIGGVGPGGEEQGEEGVGVTEVGVKQEGVKTLKITARIPWDKLSEFMSGVILPLRQDGAEIELEIELSAKSEKGINKNTLELKTKETLNQIQAEILDWSEGEE